MSSELQTRSAYVARKHHQGICSSICSCTRPFMPFSCPDYPYVHIFLACGAHVGSNDRRIVPQCFLRRTVSLVTFSNCCPLCLKFLVPTDNCICIMHKGGRPCGRSAATFNRERDKEEKANPEKRQRRLEEDDYKKTNFFAGHTPATLSPGADTVSATVLDSDGVVFYCHSNLVWTNLVGHAT